MAAALLFSATPAVAAAPFSEPHVLSPQHPPGSPFEGVRLLGALSLSQERQVAGSLRELSGLAWDADEGLLYAVSDNGDLLHLRPRFERGMLVATDLVGLMPLRDRLGAALPSSQTDAEGLALQNAANGARGDTRLAIAFEKPARLNLYRPDGTLEQALELPAMLATEDSYAAANHEFEAVVSHPELGWLLGVERPLRAADQTQLAVFDLHGNRFEFAPIDRKYSALVGLEVTPAGDLLILERVYRSLFHPIIFAVRMIPNEQLRNPGKVTVRDIVQFNSRDDWKMDNFEGFAHHEGNRYFLVSDDGANPLQHTLLLYLEILPRTPGAPP